MNGNGCSASSDVSRSSLFCAAKHDLWQEGEGESLTSPFALLHFPNIAQKGVLGSPIDTATAHIWSGAAARPPFHAGKHLL